MVFRGRVFGNWILQQVFRGGQISSGGRGGAVDEDDRQAAWLRALSRRGFMTRCRVICRISAMLLWRFRRLAQRLFRTTRGLC